MQEFGKTLKSWASILDEGTLEQAVQTSELPFIFPRKSSKPRAVVAISEDRQWLVTHEPPNLLRYKVPNRDCFYVWQRNGATGAGIAMRPCEVIEDTGQDANEVLAKFLEGQK